MIEISVDGKILGQIGTRKSDVWDGEPDWEYDFNIFLLMLNAQLNAFQIIQSVLSQEVFMKKNSNLF